MMMMMMMMMMMSASGILCYYYLLFGDCKPLCLGMMVAQEIRDCFFSVRGFFSMWNVSVEGKNVNKI